jgi:hypothetical protein
VHVRTAAVDTDTKPISDAMIAAAVLQSAGLVAVLAACRWYYPELIQRTDGQDLVLSPKNRLNPSELPGTALARWLLEGMGAQGAFATGVKSGKVVNGSRPGQGLELFGTPARGKVRTAQAFGGPWAHHCTAYAFVSWGCAKSDGRGCVLCACLQNMGAMVLSPLPDPEEISVGEHAWPTPSHNWVLRPQAFPSNLRTLTRACSPH